MDAKLLITERWLWLEVSLLVALAAGWGRWYWRRRGHPVLPWMSSLWQVLRLFYALGFPAALLLWRHGLSERFFGLKPLSAGPVVWTRDLAWTLGIGLATWLILRYLAHSSPLPRRHDGTVALREALYHQVHAAFYREPFVLLWGIGQGSWLGLLPLAFETLLDPNRWSDIDDDARSWNLLMRLTLLLSGTLLYMQTQNLWLMLLMDACVAWLIGQGATSDS